VTFVFNILKSGIRQMDGSASLTAQLDQVDEYKVLYEHLSSILPMQVCEQFASDKNRFTSYSLQAVA